MRANGSTLLVVAGMLVAAGSLPACSGGSSSPQADAPASTAPPTISGSAVDGQTLTADPGTWSGTPTIAFAFQWRRCDAGGAGCSDVPAATGATFTLGAGDVGSTFRVVVTATGPGGTADATSAQTAVVAPAALCAGRVWHGGAPTVATRTNPITLAIGDLNDDGKDDLVAGELAVHLGNGDGTFYTRKDISTGVLEGVALGDVDGDGFLDLVAIDRMPAANSLLHLSNLFNGNAQKIPGYHHARIQNAVIERGESGAIHLDGDFHPGDKEIRISILPGAVNIALPG